MRDDFYGFAYDNIPGKTALQTLERALNIAAVYTISKMFVQLNTNPVLAGIKAGIADSLKKINDGTHPQVARAGKKLVKLNRHNRRRLAALKAKEGKKNNVR